MPLGNGEGSGEGAPLGSGEGTPLGRPVGAAVSVGLVLGRLVDKPSTHRHHFSYPTAGSTPKSALEQSKDSPAAYTHCGCHPIVAIPFVPYAANPLVHSHVSPFSAQHKPPASAQLYWAKDKGTNTSKTAQYFDGPTTRSDEAHGTIVQAFPEAGCKDALRYHTQVRPRELILEYSRKDIIVFAFIEGTAEGIMPESLKPMKAASPTVHPAPGPSSLSLSSKQASGDAGRFVNHVQAFHAGRMRVVDVAGEVERGARDPDGDH